MPENSFPQICVVSGCSVSGVRRRYKSTEGHWILVTYPCVPKVIWRPELISLRIATHIGYKSVVERPYGKLDPVLDSGLAHQPPNMRFHRALLDSQLICNLLVRPRKQNQFKHLPFAHGKFESGGRLVGNWHVQQFVDQARK